ncbi:MAG TPA: DUF4157 domain-containing protein [Iamia sp.]|nr:DUF4157 domain-containing protein [Iamia sp.]
MREHVTRPAARTRRPPAPRGGDQIRREAAGSHRHLEEGEDREVEDGGRPPSLLEHLAPTGLAERWAEATATPAHAVPGRADLERDLGASLAGIAVHTGPAARSLLDHLGAEAAASGPVILLRHDDAPRHVVAHEVVHALQAGAAPAGPPTAAPLPVDHAAEQEAEAVAGALTAGAAARVPPVAVALPTGSLALRRVGLAIPSAPTEDEGAESSEAHPQGDRSGELVEVRRRRRPAGHRARHRRGETEGGPDGQTAAPEAAAPEAARPGGTPPTAETAPADTAPTRPTAGDRAETTATRPDRAPPAPDRQAEVRALADQAEGEARAGVGKADGYEVAPCPHVGVAAGTQPFARGPPVVVPPVAARPDAPAPVIAVPPAQELERARQAVDTELARGPPARAPPAPGPAAADAEQQRARDQARVEARGRVEQAAAVSPRLPAPAATPPVPDPGAAAAPAAARFEAKAATEATRARQATGERFGETALAPHRDPARDLDTRLEGLEVPAADATARVDRARIEQVATDANAGTRPLGQVVLVRSHDLDAGHQAATVEGEARARIDQSVTADQRLRHDQCQRAGEERARLDQRATDGVKQGREAWARGVDDHVATRSREGQELVATRVGHADDLAREAETTATAARADARRQADDRWRDTRQRAQRKVDEGDQQSWWDQGVAWARARLADLVGWIDRFIEGCRRAIDALLAAAEAFAHRVIEAGRAAITATIDGLHRALDVLADNLPGELGVIAREHRDRIHALLDAAQDQLDRWADDLHQIVATSIEALRTELHAALDALQQGAHDVAQAVDGVLQNGLMGLLRAACPALAALIDEGIGGPIGRAGAHLGTWLEGVVERTGLRQLQSGLDELEASPFCSTPPATAEEQAQTCEGFKVTLQGLMARVDAMLASPLAQKIQGILLQAQQDGTGQQLDVVSGFFDFIGWVAKPVHDWWVAAEPAVRQAFADLGDAGRTAWRHIALALGIDPDLGPIDALRQGLQALWKEVSDAVAPLVQGLKDAWRWIKEQSPLAPLFTLLAQLPDVQTALSQLWEQVSQGATDWFVRARDVLQQTVLPVVDRVLAVVSDIALAGVGAVDRWTAALLGALETIAGWNAGVALVDALLALVGRLTQPIRIAVRAFRSCGLGLLRGLAAAVREGRRHLRLVVDLLIGLTQALLVFPIGLVYFFAGNFWLRVLPPCYKAPIIDFVLDVAIRFVRFIPEPADLTWAVVHQGLLGFLLGLREAPEAQKVGAVNLLARVMAGDAEIAAGFLVGLLEGIWEGTGGTIIFLLQAVWWLVKLPFQLVAWGAQRMRGGPAAAGEGEGEGAGDEGAAEATEAGPVARQVVPSAATPVPTARGPPVAAVAPTPAVEEQEDPAEQLAPVGAEQDERGGDPGAALEREQGLDPADAPPGPGSEATPDPGTADATSMMREPTAPAPMADATAAEREGAEIEEAAAEHDATAPEGATDEADAVGDEVADGLVEAQPPAAPGALPDLKGLLDKLLTDGLTREDVAQLLDGARTALRGMAGRLGREAAAGLLTALNATGAGYAVGRTMGSLVGQLLVEVVLAILTAGAAAFISGAKAALTGARATSKLAGAIRKIRSALEPIVKLVERLKGAVKELMAAVRKWLDDVLRWMKGLGEKIKKGLKKLGKKGKGKKPKKPKKPKKGKGKKKKKKKKKGDEAKRRLAVAKRVLPPLITRYLAHGHRPWRVALWLWTWKIRLRLSSLKVEKNHHVVARVNPQADLKRLDVITGKQVQDLLERVLARAEDHHLHRQSLQPGSFESKVQKGMDIWRSGAKTPMKLETPEAVEMLRRIRRGGVTRGPVAKVWDKKKGKWKIPGHVVQLGTSDKDTMLVRGKRVTQWLQVGVGKYIDVPRRASARQTTAFKALHGRLERARMPGMLGTMGVADDLGKVDPKLLPSTQTGELNPMAPKNASRSADIDHFDGPAPKEGSRADKDIDKGRKERRRRQLAVFQKLRKIVRSQPRLSLLAPEKASALRRLTVAFERWLDAHVPAPGATWSEEERQKRERTFELAFIAYLQTL